jgi:hypothetical protein
MIINLLSNDGIVQPLERVRRLDNFYIIYWESFLIL